MNPNTTGHCRPLAGKLMNPDATGHCRPLADNFTIETGDIRLHR
jgi:hypothetical protein